MKKHLILTAYFKKTDGKINSIKFEFVGIESVRVERENLKRTTPNTTEHFNQAGLNKKDQNGSSWIGYHCSHYLRKL